MQSVDQACSRAEADPYSPAQLGLGGLLQSLVLPQSPVCSVPLLPAASPVTKAK